MRGATVSLVVAALAPAARLAERSGGRLAADPVDDGSISDISPGQSAGHSAGTLASSLGGNFFRAVVGGPTEVVDATGAPHRDTFRRLPRTAPVPHIVEDSRSGFAPSRAEAQAESEDDSGRAPQASLFSAVSGAGAAAKAPPKAPPRAAKPASRPFTEQTEPKQSFQVTEAMAAPIVTLDEPIKRSEPLVDSSAVHAKLWRHLEEVFGMLSLASLTALTSEFIIDVSFYLCPPPGSVIRRLVRLIDSQLSVWTAAFMTEMRPVELMSNACKYLTLSARQQTRFAESLQKLSPEELQHVNTKMGLDAKPGEDIERITSRILKASSVSATSRRKLVRNLPARVLPVNIQDDVAISLSSCPARVQNETMQSLFVYDDVSRKLEQQLTDLSFMSLRVLSRKFFPGDTGNADPPRTIIRRLLFPIATIVPRSRASEMMSFDGLGLLAEMCFALGVTSEHRTQIAQALETAPRSNLEHMLAHVGIAEQDDADRYRLISRIRKIVAKGGAMNEALSKWMPPSVATAEEVYEATDRRGLSACPINVLLEVEDSIITYNTLRSLLHDALAAMTDDSLLSMLSTFAPNATKTTRRARDIPEKLLRSLMDTVPLSAAKVMLGMHRDRLLGELCYWLEGREQQMARWKKLLHNKPQRKLVSLAVRLGAGPIAKAAEPDAIAKIILKAASSDQLVHRELLRVLPPGGGERHADGQSHFEHCPALVRRELLGRPLKRPRALGAA